MDHEAQIAALREQLLALQSTSAKRMFGADAYFVGPAMFAFFAPGAIVLRLPHAAFAEAVASERALPPQWMGGSSLRSMLGGGVDGTGARRACLRDPRRPCGWEATQAIPGQAEASRPHELGFPDPPPRRGFSFIGYCWASILATAAMVCGALPSARLFTIR